MPGMPADNRTVGELLAAAHTCANQAALDAGADTAWPMLRSLVDVVDAGAELVRAIPISVPRGRVPATMLASWSSRLAGLEVGDVTGVNPHSDLAQAADALRRAAALIERNPLSDISLRKPEVREEAYEAHRVLHATVLSAATATDIALRQRTRYIDWQHSENPHLITGYQHRVETERVAAVRDTLSTVRGLLVDRLGDRAGMVTPPPDEQAGARMRR